MSLWEAAILGLVQGLTEFLPISSSGHLVLFQKLFGIAEDALIFDVSLHLGTLVAVLVVFWSDIWNMVRRPFSRLTLLVVAGTIPTALIGLSLSDFFEELFKSGKTLGLEFLVTGAVLWWAESVRSQNKNLQQTGYLDALFIGTMQGLAIMPAISRSGLTIAGALFRGLNRELAARYSFLLSVPAILGAAVFTAKPLLSNPQLAAGVEPVPMLVGTLVAAVSGFAAVKFMLRLLTQGSIRVFSYYVWALGGLILVDQLITHFYF